MPEPVICPECGRPISLDAPRGFCPRCLIARGRRREEPREEAEPEPIPGTEVGNTVGPYTLLERIGEGGFGVVFRAGQRQPIIREVRRSQALFEEARRARGVADDSLYRMAMLLAQRDLADDRISDAHALLEQQVPAPGAPDRRGWEWYYLRSRLDQAELTLQTGRKDLRGVAWRPNGNEFAAAGGDGTISIWSNTTHSRVQILNGTKTAVWSLAWKSRHPDLLAASGHRGEVVVWSVTRGTPVWRHHAHPGEVRVIIELAIVVLRRGTTRTRARCGRWPGVRTASGLRAETPAENSWSPGEARDWWWPARRSDESCAASLGIPTRWRWFGAGRCHRRPPECWPSASTTVESSTGASATGASTAPRPVLPQTVRCGCWVGSTLPAA